MKTETLFLRVTPEVKQKLVELAQADRRSLNNFVELLIIKAYTEKE